MAKKICIVTSGRSDYGHWLPVIKELSKNENFWLTVLAPSNHPCRDELEQYDLDRLANVKYTHGINGVEELGVFFDDCLARFLQSGYDAVGLLGDRMEITLAAVAATVSNTKIFHIHGGEVTLGAFDNQFRNAITMMSTWHFASTDEYAKNIVNMTMYNWRSGQRITSCDVFVTGAPGLEGIKKMELKSLQELQRDFFIDLEKPFILCCFNSVTKELMQTRYQINNLLQALYDWGENVIMVMPNIDPGDDIIREQIYKMAAVAINKWQICECIPRDIFLSLMKYAHMMIGNSSSGIIEASYFKLPVLNIGSRQEGRIKPKNVLDCGYSEEDIFRGIRSLAKFKDEIRKMYIENPYEGKSAVNDIVRILTEVL